MYTLIKTVAAAACALWATLPIEAVQAQNAKPWMSSEVASAWQLGYRGQGVRVTVVDAFTGQSLSGKMDGPVQSLTHGQWTSKQVELVAPMASVVGFNFCNASAPLQLASGLNVLNLSYAMMSSSSTGSLNWAPLESSIISYARNAQAVVVKAAGNNAVAIGQFDHNNQRDALNIALIGSSTAIFVGALDRNGTTTAKANIASYSNFAGTNPDVQNQFLMVGVDSGQIGIAGTSFAAPIIAGYAAILGSKFTTATPRQIATQLLRTARKDTINNYSIANHGQGEASILRALAPISLQ
jgi:subtilisin family serine protease